MQQQSGRWPATTTWGERHAKLLYKSSWTPRPACLRACPAEPAATYNLCLGFRTRHRISDQSGSSVEPTQHTSGKSATDDATAAPASQGVLQAGWKRCITCVLQQHQFLFCHLAGFLLHSFFLSFFPGSGMVCWLNFWSKLSATTAACSWSHFYFYFCWKTISREHLLLLLLPLVVVFVVIHHYLLLLLLLLLLFVFVFLVWWWFGFVLVVHCFCLLCVFDWDPERGERKQQLLLPACIFGFLFSFPVGTYCRCIVCDWGRVSVVVAGVGVGLKVCLLAKEDIPACFRHL